MRVLREEGAAATGESSDEEAGTARPDSPGSPELSKKLLVAAPEEVDEVKRLKILELTAIHRRIMAERQAAEEANKKRKEKKEESESYDNSDTQDGY